MWPLLLLPLLPLLFAAFGMALLAIIEVVMFCWCCCWVENVCQDGSSRKVRKARERSTATYIDIEEEDK